LPVGGYSTIPEAFEAVATIGTSGTCDSTTGGGTGGTDSTGGVSHLEVRILLPVATGSSVVTGVFNLLGGGGLGTFTGMDDAAALAEPRLDSSTGIFVGHNA